MMGVQMFTKIAVVTGVVVLSLFGAAGAGQATSAGNSGLSPLVRVYAYQGSNYASTTGTWVEACDMERDGNGVYGEFWYGSTGHTQVWDGNGADGGCGNATLSSNVTRFRVCEDHTGCSGIVTTNF